MPELTTNFAVSTVATAPSPATSGTSLSVASGHGSRFPNPATSAFNAVVCPSNAEPTPENAEIVRVTAKSSDTFSTIVRAQEGSSARSIQVGDRIFAGVTAKTLTDLEDFSGNTVVFHEATTYHPTTQSAIVNLPIFENAPAKTVSPFSNNVPGVNFTNAAFAEIVHAQVLIPGNAIGSNNMVVRLSLASTAGNAARFGLEYKKTAHAGAITGAMSGSAAQNISLTANTLVVADFPTTAPTPNSLFTARIYRDGTHAGDTSTATVYLHAVSLVYDAKA